MKKFLVILLIFVFCQALILALALVNYDSFPEYAYMAATLDKHERLSSISPPRIIFVGGSNLAFGIRSDMVERDMGAPVVNMGLQVGLGLDFILNEVEERIGRGDIIIISPEYELFNDWFQGQILINLLMFRPESIRYCQKTKLLRAFLYEGHLFVSEKVDFNVCKLSGGNCFPSPPYMRTGFNRWGDMTLHYGMPSAKIPMIETLPAFNHRKIEVAVEKIALFARSCVEKGARVFFSYPCVPADYLEAARNNVRLIESSLKSSPGLIILGRPEDYVFARPLFYNSVYHLTMEGARERTVLIESRLREKLGR